VSGHSPAPQTTATRHLPPRHARWGGGWLWDGSRCGVQEVIVEVITGGAAYQNVHFHAQTAFRDWFPKYK